MSKRMGRVNRVHDLKKPSIIISAKKSRKIRSDNIKKVAVERKKRILFNKCGEDYFGFPILHVEILD
jgi:hypothetical protein